MLKRSARHIFLALFLLASVIAAVVAVKQKKTAPALEPVVTTGKSATKEPFNTMYSPGAAPDRRAFSAAEETYAVDLWRIHDKVKTSAVQLSFAGLSYKLKELDRVGVKAKIAPQSEVFQKALIDLGKLTVPDSLKELHQSYAKAVNLYADAAKDTMQISADGNEQHLLDAHSKSSQAGTLLLKVGAELWPGEFKPN